MITVVAWNATQAKSLSRVLSGLTALTPEDEVVHISQVAPSEQFDSHIKVEPDIFPITWRIFESGAIETELS